MVISAFDTVENIVGKGENTGKKSSIFSFSKIVLKIFFSQGRLKSGLSARVKSLPNYKILGVCPNEKHSQTTNKVWLKTFHCTFLLSWKHCGKRELSRFPPSIFSLFHNDFKEHFSSKVW